MAAQTSIENTNHHQKTCNKSPSFCLVEQSETTLRLKRTKALNGSSNIN